MTTPSRVRIGVRGGRLAGTLATEVEEALLRAHPNLEIEWVRLAADGDHVHDRVRHAHDFTRELDDALRQGRVDATLHDLADLPVVRPDAVVIAAVPRRRHPFDVLLTADGRILDELEEGERIGASTLSRRAQLLAYRDDIKTVPAPGGLETHLKQLEQSAFDGLVMAASDAERLGWHDRVSEIFTTEVCVPFPGQGALALEVLGARTEIVALLKVLDDPASHAAAVAERAWLNELGGDDDLPVGALANVVDKRLVMEAVLLSADGMEVVRDEVEGPVASAEALGAKLATRMLDHGGEDVIAALRGDADRG